MNWKLVIKISNPALRSAVEAQLASHDVDPHARLTEADVAVSTTRDLAPGECRQVARRGTHVIVLAAVPSPTEAAAYDIPGVDYVPMGLSGPSLFGLLPERQRRRDRSAATHSVPAAAR